MSGATPTAMPPLPRAPPGTPLPLATAWNQLCNALELQMRRLLAPANPTNVPQVGQTATGTNLATAFQITSDFTEFASVPPGTGAAVPAVIGWGLLVNNDATNALTLYGSRAGGTINGGASVSVAAGAQVVWSASSATIANAH